MDDRKENYAEIVSSFDIGVGKELYSAFSIVTLTGP